MSVCPVCKKNLVRFSESKKQSHLRACGVKAGSSQLNCTAPPKTVENDAGGSCDLCGASLCPSETSDDHKRVCVALISDEKLPHLVVDFEEIRCPICNKNLSGFATETVRLQHTNKCLEEQERAVEFNKKKDKWKNAIDCPMCKEPLLQGPDRIAHIKRCAKNYNVSAAETLKMVQLQENVAKINVEKGICHTKMPAPEKSAVVTKKRPRDKLEPKNVSDEQLQIVKAMSLSETPAKNELETISKWGREGKSFLGPDVKKRKTSILAEATDINRFLIDRLKRLTGRTINENPLESVVSESKDMTKSERLTILRESKPSWWNVSFDDTAEANPPQDTSLRNEESQVSDMRACSSRSSQQWDRSSQEASSHTVVEQSQSKFDLPSSSNYAENAASFFDAVEIPNTSHSVKNAASFGVDVGVSEDATGERDEGATELQLRDLSEVTKRSFDDGETGGAEIADEEKEETKSETDFASRSPTPNLFDDSTESAGEIEAESPIIEIDLSIGKIDNRNRSPMLLDCGTPLSLAERLKIRRKVDADNNGGSPLNLPGQFELDQSSIGKSISPIDLVSIEEAADRSPKSDKSVVDLVESDSDDDFDSDGRRIFDEKLMQKPGGGRKIGDGEKFFDEKSDGDRQNLAEIAAKFDGGQCLAVKSPPNSDGGRANCDGGTVVDGKCNKDSRNPTSAETNADGDHLDDTEIAVNVDGGQFPLGKSSTNGGADDAKSNGGSENATESFTTEKHCGGKNRGDEQPEDSAMFIEYPPISTEDWNYFGCDNFCPASSSVEENERMTMRENGADGEERKDEGKTSDNLNGNKRLDTEVVLLDESEELDGHPWNVSEGCMPRIDEESEVTNSEKIFEKTGAESKMENPEEKARKAKPQSPIPAVVKTPIVGGAGFKVVKRTDITPMPDYGSLRTPLLKCELSKYGMKANLAKNKKKSAALLTKIYETTHPTLAELEELERETNINWKINQDNDDQKTMDVMDDKNDVMEESLMEDDIITGCSQEGSVVDFENQTRAIIKGLPGLYRRILMCEPVPFEEIEERVKSKIKCSAMKLIDFLDNENVSWYFKNKKPRVRRGQKAKR